MKAVAIFLTSCLLSSVAYASDSLKINTVKELYESSLFYDAERGAYDSDPDAIYSYADDALNKALILQEEVGMEEGMCGVYVSPMMWNSDDPNYSMNVSYSMNRDGKVKVKLGNGGSALYSLQCSQTSCKITDIQASGISLKSMINKECR